MTELSDAVDDLTLPKPVRVQTDDGFTWATEDPLLVQLEDAIHSTMSRGGGRGGGDARMILDSDALEKFAQIASVILDWCRIAGAQLPARERRNVSDDLRLWFDTYTRTDGERLDVFYVTELRKWADLIRSKLNPRESLEFTDPCPECHETTWVNDDGELIRNPVVIDYDKTGDVLNGARGDCRACGASWVGVWALRGMRHAADELSSND